jgi:hypothetical protein
MVLAMTTHGASTPSVTSAAPALSSTATTFGNVPAVSVPSPNILTPSSVTSDVPVLPIPTILTTTPPAAASSSDTPTPAAAPPSDIVVSSPVAGAAPTQIDVLAKPAPKVGDVPVVSYSLLTLFRLASTNHCGPFVCCTRMLKGKANKDVRDLEFGVASGPTGRTDGLLQQNSGIHILSAAMRRFY